MKRLPFYRIWFETFTYNFLLWLDHINDIDQFDTIDFWMLQSIESSYVRDYINSYDGNVQTE